MQTYTRQLPASSVKRRGTVLALALTLAACLAGPSRAETDKARFASHLGITYYCFHHWISAPYREGKFVTAAPHRTATIVRAGTGLLYAVRELKAAKDVARASKDPQLQKLTHSLDSMADIFDTAGRKFKAGKFATTDVDALTGAFTAMDSSVRAAKIVVKDIPVSIP